MNKVIFIDSEWNNETVYIEDLISLDDRINIEEKAFAISSYWYKNNNKIDLYQGVPVGCICQIETYKFVFKMLMFFSFLEDFNKEGSKEIHIVLNEAQDAHLIKALVSEIHKNIKVINKNKRKICTEEIIELLKYLKVDWIVKMVLNLFVKNTQPRGFEYICLFDIYNKSMIDILKCIINGPILKDNKVLAVCGEKRIDKYLSDYSNKALLSRENSFKEVIFLRKKSRMMLMSLKEKAKDNEKIFEYRSYNFSHIFNNFYLSKRFVNYIHSIIMDIEAGNKLLKHNFIKGLFLASDCHKTSRIFAFLANNNNIKSIVIQHGVLGGKYAFVPLIAQKFAAWGSGSKEQMVNWGINHDRIVVTGNPKLDYVNRNNTIKKVQTSSQLKLMVATNPIGKNFNRILMTIVADAVRGLDIKLILKLHPGQGEQSFFRNIVDDLGLDCEIIQGNNLYSLINQCDVVITVNSTVGIEVLANCKPLIIVSIKNLPEKIPYRDYKSAFIVNNANELHTSLVKILQGEMGFDDLNVNARIFVEAFLGSYDGKSSDRIIKSLIC